MVRGLFPDVNTAWWEHACFELKWRQHGGSGLGRDYGELLTMPLDHIQRELTRLADRRDDEARKIREAYARR